MAEAFQLQVHLAALSLPCLPLRWRGHKPKPEVQNTIRDWRNLVHYTKPCHTANSSPARPYPPWWQTVSLHLPRWSTSEDKTHQWQTSISPSTKRKESCLPPTPVCLVCPLCITYAPLHNHFNPVRQQQGIKALKKKKKIILKNKKDSNFG